MFQILGKAVSKAWPVLLGGWLLLVGWATLVAPPWEEVAASGQFSFLPGKVPSNRGKELLKRAFPRQSPASNIVLVLSRNAGRKLREQDTLFVARVLKPALQPISQDPVVARIRSVTDKGEGGLLRSADNQVMVVVVELATELLTRRNWPLIDRVERLVDRLGRQHRIPRGLQIRVTGNAVVGRDIRLAEIQSADTIGRWTVIVVVVLLLVIYRAPLLALIPLATVFVAVQLSLKLLAVLAQHGFVEVSETIRIYITVLSYGAGVDYCVFLIARYREEMARGVSLPEALANAVGKVGGALAASAATVIGGIGMLAFAQFGKYHQAGICVPLSLVVVLAAALTFSPALLRAVGRWAFWPKLPADGARDSERARPRQGLPAGIWERVAQALVARPRTIWLATVAAMTPFVVVAVVHYQEVDYGISSQLPPSTAGSAGMEILKQHYPAGMEGPATVLVTNRRVYFGSRKSYRLLEAVHEELERRRDRLGLADIRSFVHPFGITRYGKKMLLGIVLSTPPASGEAVDHSSFVHYVSTAPGLSGHVTRIELLSKLDPLSQESIGNWERLERAARAVVADKLPGSQVDFAGPTVSLRDLADVTGSDFARIEILVPAVVFLILVVLLRSVTVSLYLMATVVVSFLATLGVTFLVFWIPDPAGFIGLDWKVPVFLFTILVAVGEDYNIFLLTRVREEEKVHGPVGGVTAALVQTGGVISTCGFLMAGTFAALLAGSLIETRQLGFALAFGVLLDTLIVRPVLVPAMLIWMRRRATRRSSRAGWFTW